MSGAYNVYAVAADTQVRALSGGLDVVPHYSFAQMDELLGKSPDIIAIPYMTMVNPASFQPMRDWILKHQDTQLLSICAGADNLAATGLLDGKTAATHWQTMPVMTKKYPQIHWLEDMRYVTNDNGRIVSSAGISSGIDATLYVISQQLGEPAAAAIAKAMNYPTYHFVQNPKVEPFKMDVRYTNYVLNNGLQWNKQHAGVLLYSGVEELALASVFDIYSDTGTTRVTSIGGTDQPVMTQHGLNVLPRETIHSIKQVDKMIVPGQQAKTLAVQELKAWNAKPNAQAPQFVHADAPNRFFFDAQLEDLAKQEDVLTAQHALKRLEYRASDIQLEGAPFSLETYGELLVTAGIAMLGGLYAARKWVRKRRVPVARA
jgi:transcriptional regulator GlxA family with amidase domain